MNSKHASRFTYLGPLGVLLAATLLAGCMLLDPGSPSDQLVDQAQAEPSAGSEQAPSRDTADDPDLPGVELSGELLYRILLGEIAVKRGDYKTAATALIDAAEESRDYRLAERATRVALSAGLFGLAYDATRLWSELRPGDDRPKEALAMVLAENGRIDESISILQELAQSSADQWSYRRAAELLTHVSNPEHAIATMQGLIDTDPDSAEAYFSMAYLAGRLKRDELIEQSLDSALALQPDWEEAALTKLGFMVRARMPEDHISAFSLGYLDRNPEAVNFHAAYARYLVEASSPEIALSEFESLVEQHPRSTEGLYAAALLSMQLQEYDKANSYLLKHLKLTPENDQIRLYLGQVAENRDRYREARKRYLQVKGNDHWFDARIHLGPVISKLDGADAAMAHLGDVRPQTQEEFVRLTLTKDMVLREAGRLDQAREILNDAVDRYPDDSDLLYARGLVLAQMNLIEEHEKDMRQLLSRDPNNAHALNALGYTLADATDRVDEAYELIQLALSIRPDDPFILDSMGWVEYRLGNNERALEYLRRAFEKRQDAEIAAHLGEVLWVTGDKARAREIWQQGQEMYPENEVLKETLQRFLQ